MLVLGQWAPIAGTALAVLGSLYVLLDARLDGGKREANPTSPVETMHSTSEPNMGGDPQSNQPHGHEEASRRKVAGFFAAVVDYVSNPAHGRFDDSTFKNGDAADYPWIPGEEQRNPNYGEIKRHSSQVRVVDGRASPTLRGHSSRSGSLSGSVASGIGLEGSTKYAGGLSSQSPQSPDSRRPFPSLTTNIDPTTQHVTTRTGRTGRTVSEPQTASMNAGANAERIRPHPRRETLQVPPLVYHSPTWEHHSTSFYANRADVQNSPTIVVSPSFNPPHPGDVSFKEPRTPP